MLTQNNNIIKESIAKFLCLLLIALTLVLIVNTALSNSYNRNLNAVSKTASSTANQIKFETNNTNTFFYGSNSLIDGMNSQVGNMNSWFGEINLPHSDMNSQFGDSNSQFGDTNSLLGDSNLQFDDISLMVKKTDFLTDDTNTQVGDTNSPLGDTNSLLGDSNSQFDDTNTQVGDTNSLLGDSNSQFDDTNTQVGDTNTQVCDTNLRLDSVAMAVGHVSTSARSAVLMDAKSGAVLVAKNGKQPLPMASTTKIVTALTVIKNTKNLDEVVTVDSRAVGIEGSSIYLRANERLTVRELLYGLMLQSGNDSAVALAIHVGGSVEKFCQMMKETALSCGATNSNFVNPHGLSEAGHFTTAEDLAKISACAILNDDFSQIVGTKQKAISNEGFSYLRQIVNKNKLLYRMDDANGIKTGFTKVAGRCFVGSAKRGEMQLVAVVLNCGPMFEDSQKMLEYGFSNYEYKQLIAKNQPLGFIFNKGKYVAYSVSQDISVLTKIGENSNYTYEIELFDNKSPLKPQEVGEIRILLDNRLLFSKKLYTI